MQLVLLFLINILFVKYPSIKEKKTCNDCGVNVRREHAVIGITLPTPDFNFLQERVDEYMLFPGTCRWCSGVAQRKMMLLEYLSMEIFPPYDGTFQCSILNVPLSDIPKNIKVEEKILQLRGTVVYIDPGSTDVNAVGHYTAYCWRDTNKRWELYDDLLGRMQYASSTTKVDCRFLIYTI